MSYQPLGENPEPHALPYPPFDRRLEIMQSPAEPIHRRELAVASILNELNGFFKRAVGLTGSAHLAEDVMQDASLKLWTMLKDKKLAGPDHLRSIMASVIAKTSIDESRKAATVAKYRSSAVIGSDKESQLAASQALDPAEIAIRRDDIALDKNEAS
jgi:DNA-directed RNA polymerase specialized sigma24 family protein